MISNRTRWRRRIFLGALWLIVLLLVLGLALTDDPAAQLESQADKWRQARPVKYQYVLSIDSYGYSTRIPVAVNNGEVSYPAPLEEKMKPEQRQYTIEWLFARVQAQLDQGATITHSRYDRQLGYPQVITLDEEEYNDRWLSFSIQEFQVGE